MLTIKGCTVNALRWGIIHSCRVGKTSFPFPSLTEERSPLQFSSVQSLSRVRLFATPWTAACQAFLSITNHQSLLSCLHWVGDAIQPSHPLSSLSPPALSLSQHQGIFKWVSYQYSSRVLGNLQFMSCLTLGNWFVIFVSSSLFIRW